MATRSNRRNEIGFGVVEALIIVVVLVLIGLIGWYLYKHHQKTSHSSSSSSASSSSKASTSDIIKPQLSGIINQNGSIPSNYLGAVNGFDLAVKWSSLQPNSGSELDTSTIDAAISTAQTNHLHIFLNVESGQEAPKWVENLAVTNGRQGPLQICDNHDARSTGGTKNHCGLVPHFWESDYQQAYKNLMQQLAVKYDQNPYISEVGIAGCMTVFNEPFVRQGNDTSNTPYTNVQNYAMAGMTTSGDDACEHAQIDAMKVWTHTDAYLSFNAYEQWNGNGFTINEDYTESMIKYCRDTLGERCVLGNESVGNNKPALSVYSCSDMNGANWSKVITMARMYTAIKCAGPPIQLRSSTPAELTKEGLTLANTIPWVISEGAAGFEPPSGYNNSTMPGIYLSTAQVKTYNVALAANARPSQ